MVKPAPNAKNILQACIYKSVNTRLFLKSLLAPSIVKFALLVATGDLKHGHVFTDL